ncbi:mycothiol transferase [Streptomyces sp. NPDC002092]
MTENLSETTPVSEVRAVLRALDEQRHHILGILDGLDAKDLRRPALASGWHCLGLVQHLALDVERFRFCATPPRRITGPTPGWGHR